MLQFICFDNDMEFEGAGSSSSGGTVNIDELGYIFSLGYQLLNRITDIDLNRDASNEYEGTALSPKKPKTFGSAIIQPRDPGSSFKPGPGGTTQ